MKHLPLTNSPLTAIVDDEDYRLVSSKKWRLTPNGYVVCANREAIAKSGQTFLQTAILWRPSGRRWAVDHINHNKLDNRRSNLRVVPASHNIVNSAPRNGRRFKGVTWLRAKCRWRAYIKFKKRHHYAGTHLTEIAAARAYNRLAFQLYGDSAWLNPVVPKF